MSPNSQEMKATVQTPHRRPGAARPLVYVTAQHAWLRQALAKALIEGSVDVFLTRSCEGLGAGGIVVAAASECDSEDCASLAERGLHIVILAALPSAAERERYIAAGARTYLPMTVDSERLVGEIANIEATDSPATEGPMAYT